MHIFFTIPTDLCLWPNQLPQTGSVLSKFHSGFALTLTYFLRGETFSQATMFHWDCYSLFWLRCFIKHLPSWCCLSVFHSHTMPIGSKGARPSARQLTAGWDALVMNGNAIPALMTAPLPITIHQGCKPTGLWWLLSKQYAVILTKGKDHEDNSDTKCAIIFNQVHLQKILITPIQPK